MTTDVTVPHGMSQLSSAVDGAHIQHRRRLHKLADVSRRLLPTEAAKHSRSIETTQSQTGRRVAENCNLPKFANTLQFGAPVHLLKNMPDMGHKPPLT